MLKDEDGVLTGPMAAALEAEFGVSARIAPQDYIMNALIWVMKDVGVAFRHYVEDGRANALAVKAALEKFDGARLAAPLAPLSLLDFASGYGRVGRHLSEVMPAVSYTAMDIHPTAVTFNRDVLGLETILSHNEPELVSSERTFDYVVALSFFSHVRRGLFDKWLQALHRLMKPGGILVFTAHGRESHAATMPDVAIDADGYGMMKTSEQFDLSTDYYVQAITYETFVVAAIKRIKGLEIVAVEPASWWGHQDMYVVRCVEEAAPSAFQRMTMRVSGNVRYFAGRARRTLGRFVKSASGKAQAEAPPPSI